MGTGDLQYNLYILEKEGLISFKRYGQYKHFYPNKTLGEKQKDVLSILSQEAPRDILLFLTQTPGTKQKDVARYIKTSSPTARWYLRKLEALGLIWSRKHGREV
ncbi:MAG: winged helix-turn-helix transcriptional regulator, partial [Nitrososphaerales archaeon]